MIDVAESTALRSLNKARGAEGNPTATLAL
jgi:hypothetical protein